MSSSVVIQPIGADQADVQQRIGEVLADLGLSINAGSKLAGINAGQISRAIHHNVPGAVLLNRLAAAWAVPAWVFFVPRCNSIAEIEAARGTIMRPSTAVTVEGRSA